MPVVYGDRGINAWMRPDALYSALVNEVVSNVFQIRSSRASPTLTLLALGGLLHSDVWEDTTTHNFKELNYPEVLRLRLYQIKHQGRGINHRCSVTRVAMGSARTIGHLFNNLAIFEPYWLG